MVPGLSDSTVIVHICSRITSSGLTWTVWRINYVAALATGVPNMDNLHSYIHIHTHTRVHTHQFESNKKLPRLSRASSGAKTAGRRAMHGVSSPLSICPPKWKKPSLESQAASSSSQEKYMVKKTHPSKRAILIKVQNKNSKWYDSTVS